MTSKRSPAEPTAELDDLTVTPLAPGRWGARLRHADVGHAVAVGVNAVLADAGGTHPITVATHFVSPVAAGAVEISVGHIDRMRRRTTVDAMVRQHGRVVARLLVTTATTRGETGSAAMDDWS